MNLNDYLPYYLGAKAKGVEGSMIYTLASVCTYGKPEFLDSMGNHCMLRPGWKLMLRSLNDMTVEEEEHCGMPLCYQDQADFDSIRIGFQLFHYLLQQKFDLFGLIKAKLVEELKLKYGGTN